MDTMSVFIDNYKTEINNRDWNRVYSAARTHGVDMSKFTHALLSVGVNPVEDINRVPDFYLYDDKIITKLSSVCKSAERIGKKSFAFSNIKEVDFPKNLKSIGYGAFTSCYNIEKLDLPEGLEEIGDNAFFSCNHITEIYLPSTLFFVGEESFSRCTRLRKVIYNGYEEDFSLLFSNLGRVFSDVNKIEFEFVM